jgi:hypothetical protein
LHLGLLAASIPVRYRLLRTLAQFARLFHTTAGMFKNFGTDRGGMMVEVSGLDGAGVPVEANWTLVAEAGHGPFIPTLPALAAIRALGNGRLRRPGAGVCAGVLDLDCIEEEFMPYRIMTQTRTDSVKPPLFARCLGARFAALPKPIQEVHSPNFSLALTGIASVEGPKTLFARAIAKAFGFPPPGQDIPIHVRITRNGESEIWTRDFAGKRFTTELHASVRPGCLQERFGLFRFELYVPTTREGLSMELAGWRLGPLPLPISLAPNIRGREFVDDRGRFRFDVSIDLPLAGRVVHYCGWLFPDREM